MTLIFAVCFALWLVLSGHWDPLHLGLGAAAAGAVAAVNRRESTFQAGLDALPRLLAYLPWLLWQILVANLQVAAVVLHPRLPIDPVVLRVPTALASDLAVTALANSITLTPGTVTLDVAPGVLVVHALTGRAAAEPGIAAMRRRVAHVFGETP